MNLSFAGCGFLGIYHVGVAVCFRKYAPHVLLDKISGASAGAISACCMLCEMPLGEVTSDVLRLVTEARSGSLGPFSPSFNVQNTIMDGLFKYLPDDAHIRVSGKLHISLTRVYDGKNVIVSQFNSKDDLIQALLASCFIPVFSGVLPPKFHGIRYMDGGFSDNLPILDENTITVSPFCGESDICPRDVSSQLFHINIANTSIELSKQNIGRFTRILFPPNPEVLSKMCKQGFDDALRFLHRNNLISCTRCLAVQSTFEIQEALDDSTIDYDPECHECKLHKQESMIANLPDTVTSVFQSAIDSTNKRLLNRIFPERGTALLSILTLPYTVPIDVVYATFTKIMSFKPRVRLSLWEVWSMLLRQAHSIISSPTHSRPPLTTQPPALRRKGHKTLSRLGEDTAMFPALNEDVPIDDDSFEQVLHVTSHHEALIAYFYTDTHNQMKVTEIFDLSESENIQSPSEREINRQLEFDDWDNDQISFYENELEDVTETIVDNDSNMMSDPESEWSHRNTSESDSQHVTNHEPADDSPESDQPMVQLPRSSLQDLYHLHHT